MNTGGGKLSETIGKHTAVQERDHKQVELKCGSTREVWQLGDEDIKLPREQGEDKKNISKKSGHYRRKELAS